MEAKNRPMFCLSAMSATLRKANINPMHSARIDQSISSLVDLTGANERIFKSPIPLVYSRLTARFLTIFLVLLAPRLPLPLPLPQPQRLPLLLSLTLTLTLPLPLPLPYPYPYP